MQISYSKLVRDRIREIIQADGHRTVTRVLDEESYPAALLEKLIEEAHEARQAAVGGEDLAAQDLVPLSRGSGTTGRSAEGDPGARGRRGRTALVAVRPDRHPGARGRIGDRSRRRTGRSGVN